MPDLTILGQTVRQPLRQLETFPAPPAVTQVTLASEEFTSICPITGQPDFQTVSISYQPAGCCLESKSLKLYLWSFREEGHFCEALAERIAQDVMAALQARSVQVTVQQRPRGGISIMAVAEVHHA